MAWEQQRLTAAAAGVTAQMAAHVLRTGFEVLGKAAEVAEAR